MDVRQGFVDCVGRTPLIRWRSSAPKTGCEIAGKAEFMNPGGSVKDRAALYIIRDAERRGVLQPGGTVVEGTAGSTGIGTAHICAARGYRCVIVIPDTQSPDKMAILRTLGAEVRPVPAAYRDEQLSEDCRAARGRTRQRGVGQPVRQRRQSPGALRDDRAEIWRDTAGTIDAFVCATGTGGTLAGVSRYLKRAKPDVRIVLADPHGSGLYGYVKTGDLGAEGSSITEGIGSTRVTMNLADTPIDDAVRIDDQQCVTMVYRLLREGCASADRAASTSRRRSGWPAGCLGRTIVTLLCDRGDIYRAAVQSGMAT